MQRVLAIIFLAVMGVPQLVFAEGTRQLCHDFSSDIEPEMRREVSDFTKENYDRSQKIYETTVREWMENKFERNKKYPQKNGKLFEGEIWLADANHFAIMNGYVLKLEYLGASPDAKEPARRAFCKFVVETPYYD